jgi:RNA polymerase sigma factor (sigma-70 family)
MISGMLPEESDDLIERCIERRPGAWEEFIRRYADVIYTTIRRVGLRPDDADEAFQCTIVAAFRTLQNLKKKESLVPWVIGIAYRQAINRIRSRTRSREVPIGQSEFPDPGPPPDQEMRAIDHAERLAEAFALMPERCRRLLHILFYEDPVPDYEAISQREGLPVGSIGPTRLRCLKKMREILQERGWIPRYHGPSGRD